MNPQYVGTLAWANKTGGTLSIKDRLSLVKTVLTPTMVSLSRTWLRLDKGSSISIENIATPDTAAIKSAYALLASCADDSIINHSFRTYYWSAAFAEISGIQHDPELLLASCLLHDLGMTEAHHGKYAGCHCFAVDGAMTAKSWANDIGWPEERQHTLAEAISLHMNGHVSIDNGAEAHLLQQGATCDVIGSRFYELGKDYRKTVINQYPRLGLNQQFIDFISLESYLRPNSRSNLMRLSGFSLLVKTNPFDE